MGTDLHCKAGHPGREARWAVTRSSKSFSEQGLSALRAFGYEADRCVFPRIDVGGFIIPGHEPSDNLALGRKDIANVGREDHGPEETGPATGSREGRRASPAAASGSAASAFRGRVIDELKLEELMEYYPDTRVVHHSPGFIGLRVGMGLFLDLPYRADLFMEINESGSMDHWWDRESTFVPDVRAWAFWQDGFLVRAFHQYPDFSVCAYMREEWIQGRDHLCDLADWYACWIAKVLHLQFMHRWPGRHHCSANVRFKRNKLDEYCGCGSSKRYRQCHMDEDFSRSSVSRILEEYQASFAYLRELERRGLERVPSWLPLTMRG